MGLWDTVEDMAEATIDWGNDTFSDPWDRGWRVGSGIIGGLYEIPLMVIDMGKAFQPGAEAHEVEDAFWNAFTDHAAKAVENITGAETGLGALAGGLSGTTRDNGRAVFHGLDWIRDNGISQPIATTLLVPSVVGADNNWSAWDKLFDGKTYAESWKMANDLSPGQAFMLGFMTDNIYDTQEVNRVMGTSLFNVTSGLTDFALSWKLDPLVLAGKGLKLGREFAAAGNLEDLQRVATPDNITRLIRREAAGDVLGPIEKLHLKTARLLNQKGVNAFVNYVDYPSLTTRLGRRFAARAINPGTSQADIVRILKPDVKLKIIERVELVSERAVSRYAKTAPTGSVPFLPGGQPVNFDEIVAGELKDALFSGPRFRSYDVNPVATAFAKARNNRATLENLTDFYFFGDTRATHAQWQLLYDAQKAEADIAHRMDLLRGFETMSRDLYFKGTIRAQTDRAMDSLFDSVVTDFLFPAARKKTQLRSFKQRQEYSGEMRTWMETLLGSAQDDVNAYGNVFRMVGEEVPNALTKSADDMIRAVDLPSPALRAADKWRYSIKTSDWWQKDFSSRPFRLMTNMTPHNMVDHSRSDADVQVARFLEQTGLPQSTKMALRGRYMAALDIDERHTIFDGILDATFTHAALEAGVDKATVNYVLHELIPARLALKIQGNKFVLKDPNGLALIASSTPTGIKAVGVVGDESSLFSYIPNFRQLRKHFRRRATISSRFDTTFERLKGANYPFINRSPGAGGYKFSSMRKGLQMKGDPTDLGFVGSIQKSAGDLLGGIQGIWAPAVIIDPNWTLRVVMMDEQVRMAAKFIGMLGFNNSLLALKQGSKNWVFNTIDREYKIPQWMGYTHKNITARTNIRAAAIGGMLGWGAAGGTEDPNDMIALMLAGAVGNASLAKIMRGIKKAPFDFGIRPFGYERAFGNSTDRMNEYEVLNSAGTSSMSNQFWRNEGLAREEIEGWLHWGKDIRVRNVDELAPYQASWEYMTNNILREDPMGRQILREIMTEEATKKPLDAFSLLGPRERTVRWLYNTGEGRAVLRAMPSRGRYREDAETWVGEAVEEMSRMFRFGGRAQTTGAYHDLTNIRNVLAKNDTNFAEFLKHNRDDITNLPAINAARKREVLGNRYSTASLVDRAIAKGMDMFGRLPTDNLSRNPTFAIFYEMEVARLHGIYTANGTKLSKQAIASIEARGRNYALNQTKELLYDLAERSEFAEMMKFIIPFYPAMQEVLTRYASLAVENPVFAAHLVNIWRRKDENPFFHKDESTGTEYYRFRLPSWAKSLAKHTFFDDAFDSLGSIDLPIKSLNMITQGPGFGPFVQVPMAQMAQNNPTMEQSLDFMFPFGIPGGGLGNQILQSFTPSYVKRGISIARGEDDDAMASARHQIILTHMVDIELGKRPPVDFDDPAQRAKFLQETAEEAKEFMMLRLVSSLFSPAAPRFGGAYQDSIDVYRTLLSKDPSTADEVFLTEYGEEYFAMTQSVTKTNNGMPSTIEGMAAMDEFADIIEQYPEWAGVITGLRGGGAVKFSRLAYESQLSTPLYEGGREMQREKFTPEELIQDNRTQLTWTRFSQQMDLIDALMEERGLPNLRVKAAADLAIYKRTIIQMLGMENEAWLQDYMSFDPTKWPKQIKAFEAMANHPRLINRPDIEGLKQYLDMRRQVQLLLEQENIGRLDATAAVTIRNSWETAVQALIAKNLMFADLYHRYLENDPVVD